MPERYVCNLCNPNPEIAFVGTADEVVDHINQHHDLVTDAMAPVEQPD